MPVSVRLMRASPSTRPDSTTLTSLPTTVLPRGATTAPPTWRSRSRVAWKVSPARLWALLSISLRRTSKRDPAGATAVVGRGGAAGGAGRSRAGVSTGGGGGGIGAWGAGGATAFGAAGAGPWWEAGRVRPHAR